MESEPLNTSNIPNYWIKLAISVFFGMITYYLLEYLPPLQFLEGNWGTSLSFFVYFGIYLACLILIPFIYLRIKTSASLWQTLKISLFKDMGTPFALYLLLCTINHILNMW